MSAIKHWSVYRLSDGHFTGQQVGMDSAMSEDQEARFLKANTPGECALIGERRDPLSERVNVATGEVEPYQPSQPSAQHEWDESAKRWRLNAEASGRSERKAVALARIAHLEANVQPRTLREVALNQAAAVERLQAIDEEIAALRRDIIG